MFSIIADFLGFHNPLLGFFGLRQKDNTPEGFLALVS